MGEVQHYHVLHYFAATLQHCDTVGGCCNNKRTTTVLLYFLVAQPTHVTVFFARDDDDNRNELKMSNFSTDSFVLRLHKTK